MINIQYQSAIDCDDKETLYENQPILNKEFSTMEELIHWYDNEGINYENIGVYGGKL
jgi:hypothetical protein